MTSLSFVPFPPRIMIISSSKSTSLSFILTASETHPSCINKFNEKSVFLILCYSYHSLYLLSFVKMVVIYVLSSVFLRPISCQEFLHKRILVCFCLFFFQKMCDVFLYICLINFSRHLFNKSEEIIVVKKGMFFVFGLKPLASISSFSFSNESIESVK